MKNRKGSVLFYSLMLGLTIIVLALGLAPAVKQQIDSVRANQTIEGTAGLDCDEVNGTISNYNKAACIIIDLTIFQFIGGLIFIAGAVVTAKIIFS